MQEETPQPEIERQPQAKPAVKPLPEKVKRFIVQQLACYERPSDARRAALEAFTDLPAGVEVTDNRVRSCDPTTARGAGLSKALTELFWKTRRGFDEQAELVLVGQLRHRLGLYNAIATRALNKGNEQLALQSLKQAAQDAGGVFTNRRELTGAKGGPVETVSMSLDDWKREAAGREAQVSETMSMFDEGGDAGGEADDA